jgi:hypothetical protein
VGFGKRWLFNDLAVALFGAEVNGGSNGGRAHVIRFLNSTEQNLIELIREREQFVVIHFNDKGNLVRVFAGDGSENTERGSHGITAAFNRELDDVFTVEIVGILGEAGAAGMLDALIDRENR